MQANKHSSSLTVPTEASEKRRPFSESWRERKINKTLTGRGRGPGLREHYESAFRPQKNITAHFPKQDYTIQASGAPGS
jgi:hypothetical protein